MTFRVLSNINVLSNSPCEIALSMTNETTLCKIPFSTFKFTCQTVEKRPIDLFKSALEGRFVLALAGF